MKKRDEEEMYIPPKEQYQSMLKGLLDRCSFYAGKDGVALTPRSYFEKNYEQLCEAPFVYFKEIMDSADVQAADAELKQFIEYGGDERAAYLLIEEKAYALDGETLTLDYDANGKMNAESTSYTGFEEGKKNAQSNADTPL